MSQFDLGSYCWATYWTTNPIIESENPLCQIGRTVNKVPIEQHKWLFHLNEIEQMLELGLNDDLLDLCAGNGIITMPLSLKCRSVTAVDVSKALLEKIDTILFPNINIIIGDVRNISLQSGGVSKGLMYCALQYFSEREVIGIFDTIYRSLRHGGIFLIGDIPDIDRLFAFYSKPAWVIAYFDSLRTNTPAIGTWFKKEILVRMAEYIGFSGVEVVTQHTSLINSHYRFDLLLTK